MLADFSAGLSSFFFCGLSLSDWVSDALRFLGTPKSDLRFLPVGVRSGTGVDGAEALAVEFFLTRFFAED